MKSVLLTFFCVFGLSICAQEKYQTATVAFYNVENLFDTLNSADVISPELPLWDSQRQVSMEKEKAIKMELDSFSSGGAIVQKNGQKIIRHQILSDDFTSLGKHQFNSEKYELKLSQISYVLSQIGRDISPVPPVLIGLCEVENAKVLEALTQSENLKRYPYKWIHFNSMDPRGIDVALLYNEKRFTPITSKALQRKPKRIYPRHFVCKRKVRWTVGRTLHQPLAKQKVRQRRV
ncbi:MAG: hypothetical protein C4K58_00845 [Flavobacteriaceae bacterium]|nr:MAG: hypothetical protein C4K58_00845 [Flavobacteriaceae bacterium]